MLNSTIHKVAMYANKEAIQWPLTKCHSEKTTDQNRETIEIHTAYAGKKFAETLPPLASETQHLQDKKKATP